MEPQSYGKFHHYWFGIIVPKPRTGDQKNEHDSFTSLGRSTNDVGPVSIVGSGINNTVLKRKADSLLFWAVETADIADGAITAAKLASDVGWKKYSVVTSLAVNTASEVESIKTSIPANDWADGDIITIDAILNGKNNTGVDHTITFKVYYGSTSATIVASRTINTASAEASWRIQVELWRVGTSVFVRWLRRESDTDGAGPSSLRLPGSSAGGFPQVNEYAGNFGVVWTGELFNTTKDLKITTQFDAASAELFLSVWSAKIHRW